MLFRHIYLYVKDITYMKKTIEQSIVSYIVKPIDIELLLKGIEKASFNFLLFI